MQIRVHMDFNLPMWDKRHEKCVFLGGKYVEKWECHIHEHTWLDIVCHITLRYGSWDADILYLGCAPMPICWMN